MSEIEDSLLTYSSGNTLLRKLMSKEELGDGWKEKY